MNIGCFLRGPKTANFSTFFRGPKFKLVRGPGTDLGRDVPICLLPHLRPQRSEKRRDLVLSVQLAEKEEIVVPGFVEQEGSAVVLQVVLFAGENSEYLVVGRIRFTGRRRS